MLLRVALALSFTGLATTPASAHPGQHAQMSLLEIAMHYAEPDHLAFLALTVIVGWLAFRWGRRVEAKARAGASKREGGRE